MKISNVTLELFAWDDIPATSYGSHTGRFVGRSDLGLVRIQTDEGIEGHAFLGSAMNPASNACSPSPCAPNTNHPVRPSASKCGSSTAPVQ